MCNSEFGCCYSNCTCTNDLLHFYPTRVRCLLQDAFCKDLKKQIITQFKCGNHTSCTEPKNSTRCSFSRGGEKKTRENQKRPNAFFWWWEKHLGKIAQMHFLVVKKTSREHFPNTFSRAKKGKSPRCRAKKTRKEWISSSVDGVDAFTRNNEKAPKRTIRAKGSCYFEIPNIQQITRFWSQPKCILFHQTNIQMVDTRRFLSTGNLRRLWMWIWRVNIYQHLPTWMCLYI